MFDESTNTKVMRTPTKGDSTGSYFQIYAMMKYLQFHICCICVCSRFKFLLMPPLLLHSSYSFLGTGEHETTAEKIMRTPCSAKSDCSTDAATPELEIYTGRRNTTVFKPKEQSYGRVSKVKVPSRKHSTKNTSHLGTIRRDRGYVVNHSMLLLVFITF